MNENKMTRRLSYPYVVWMAIFVIVPLIIVCIYGLTDSNGSFTLENVKSIAEPVHLKALFLSLKLSIISTILCFALGIDYSWTSFKKQWIYHIYLHIADVDEFFASNHCVAVPFGKNGSYQYVPSIFRAAKTKFNQYGRSHYPGYDLQFFALYGSSHL